MHHFEGPNGTSFNFNSDLSGYVVVPDSADVDGASAIRVADLLAFADHVRGGYSPEEQVRQGAAFWGEVDREVDKERERIEFIRRAAVAFRRDGCEDSYCWAKAKTLWDAKPEDC